MMDLFDFAPPAAGRHAELFWSVVELIRSRAVLRPNERVLVGVSGGADSTALALLLSPLRMHEGFLGLDLHIAHFDHQLRARSEADEDKSFVEGLCERLRIPLACQSGDVRAYARKGHLSIEDAARRLRYSFFAAHAERVAATVVAVGHTKDDQAETVLLHLIRGSGLKGLRGMLPRSEWPFGPGPDLARPLLMLRRPDTEFYCERAGVKPRQDPTNLSLGHIRNRVRQTVLPAMREINPRVDEALARLASSVESDLDHLEREADGIWRSVANETSTQVRFRKGTLFALDPALTSRLLTRAAVLLAGQNNPPTHAHLERAQNLLRSPRDRWSTSFPGGLHVAAGGNFVWVSVGSRATAPAIPETSLRVAGVIEAGGWRIEARREPTPDMWETRKLEVTIAGNVIEGRLKVRSRINGDRLRPMGLKGSKKLQDIFVDAKVPAEERDGIPIICDDAGILWVIGHCLDERARVPEGAREVLHITALKKI